MRILIVHRLGMQLDSVGNVVLGLGGEVVLLEVGNVMTVVITHDG
jgi:hypothetical protein